ncbi:MAG: flagellar filament capping protein FliD [Clostridiales bacterium]|jgi:flagellar hook-associated protein 2|nr:flagellar filament capping protein FliD [Clostridiales bacterium]
MYTNKTRFTGLSGIDTQSMIEQLMKAESMKLYSLQRSTQLTSWKQEAYRATADVLKGFQNDFLTLTSGLKMRNPSSYSPVSYKATVNGVSTDAVELTTSNGMKSGDYKVEIKQLAQKDSYTGSKEFGGEVKSSVDANAQNFRVGDSFNVTLDGTTKSIELTQADIDSISLATSSDEKTQAFAGIMQSKVNTAFGSGKVTVSNDNLKLSFTTNKGNAFSINEGKGRDTKATAGTALDKLTADSQITFTAKNSDGNDVNISVDLKTDMEAADVVKAINRKLSEEKVTSISFGVDDDGKVTIANPNSNSDVTITNASSLSQLGFSTGGSVTIEKTNIMGETGITPGTATNLDLSRSVKDIFGSDFTFDASGKASFEINGKTIEIEETDTLSMFVNKVNSADAGVKLSFDNLTRKFSIESVESGAVAEINMSQSFKDALGFNTRNTVAQDAILSVNGIETTRPTNNVDINGLKLTLNSASPGKVIDLKVTSDTSVALDSIKKFVEGYNSIVEKLNSDVSTTRIRNSSGIAYQPLTDDEKDAMSADEIEMWEEKAKEGTLYRDDILSKTLSDLRLNMYQPVELSNGKKLSLHEIGITTSSSYNDGGKLVIDEDKLMKALEERGDDVTELFTKQSSYSYSDKTNYGSRLSQEGIAERMNDLINDAAGSNGKIAQRAGFENSLSATTNDIYKQLKADYDRMEDMREYLYEKETYYYSMFSKMESAITEANNQMSYLQAQLGG